MKNIPRAYLITYTCYGTRLHGSEMGSVDKFHNKRGSPFIAPDVTLLEIQATMMSQPRYRLDFPRAKIALYAMKDVARHRKWELPAAHLMRTHVHLVIRAGMEPEKIIGDMKSYSSRALNAAGFENNERKRWTRGGSARYLWTERDVARAINYVLFEQKRPMYAYDTVGAKPRSQ